MKKLYAILDTVAEFYSPIFQAENDAHASRMFVQSIDLDHKHDFALYYLGDYNSDDGNIKEKTPRLVLHGKAISDKGTDQ